MDHIEINGLRLRCPIGCSDEERRDLSDVMIDLRITTDAHAAARSDNLTDAWNYRTPTKAVIALVQGGGSWNTVEALAEEIAAVVIGHGAPAVMVRLHKPGALRFADSVGVAIERSSKDLPAPRIALHESEAVR